MDSMAGFTVLSEGHVCYPPPCVAVPRMVVRNDKCGHAWAATDDAEWVRWDAQDVCPKCGGMKGQFLFIHKVTCPDSPNYEGARDDT